MKFFLFYALMIQTTLSFAGYSCDEKDSQLTVEFLDAKAVKVTHVSKRVSRIPLTKIFAGYKIENGSSVYYKIEEFELSGFSGNANLKISTIPVMSRIPTCPGRRICDDVGDSFSKFEISAELDEAGKITHYDCQKF